MTQSTETTSATIWLSKGAFEKLTAELEYLKGPRRQEVLAEITAARDEGDLKENGGYHAAREEQGKLEGQIQQLEALLQKADSTVPEDDNIVSVGKLVTFKFEGDDDDEAETRLIASIEMKDYAGGIEISSAASPVGEALIGAGVGDAVTYEGPRGPLKVEILKIEVFTA
ncbi:transcription elongation factor GreA [Nocardioides albertanoniae]|uniref:Transcription elongation factor GreA n=1 Tax=Nocardioides albertanoniae TaxID=1175486 RepID=A0A543ABG1_9ACTN|nr:transcription elongation factor GreA [Nocardioides albertanoniae]TQL69899.1 transcription elongation factor GreA [Nocardioides albertanoniae]